jgi:hypothetical protein
MIQKDVENPWKTLGTWSTLGYPIGDITRKKHDEGFHWDIIFPFSCFLWTFTGNNHSIYSTGSAIGKWAEHIFTRMNCRKPQNGNLAIYWVRFYIFYLSEVAWCQEMSSSSLVLETGTEGCQDEMSRTIGVHDCSIWPTDATNCRPSLRTFRANLDSWPWPDWISARGLRLYRAIPCHEFRGRHWGPRSHKFPHTLRILSGFPMLSGMGFPSCGGHKNGLDLNELSQRDRDNPRLRDNWGWMVV